MLLFNQFFSSKQEAPEYVNATLPINLLYLASYLNSKGMDCKIYELGIFDLKNAKYLDNGKIRCGLTDEEITAIILKENPAVIGIGCLFTVYFWDIVEIAKLIKKVNPAIKVALGGNHATIFADSILKEAAFDFVVRGEGELTMLELCALVLAGNGDFSKVNGLSYKDSSGVVMRNPDRELIKDLDVLPMPDYSLLNVKAYSNPVENSPYVMRYPLIGMMTSRGCPGRCVFCTVKAVWGRTWRARSAQNTVDEVELLVKKHGIREISFLVDSVSINKKRWHEICTEIIKRKIDVKWTTPNGIAYWTLDNDTLDLMKKAGCYRVTFGIESANEETKKFIGKPYPVAQAQALIRYANKIGMWTICTNILGFPYETKEQIMDTVNFAKTSGTDFALFFLLAPFVTSDVYEYFKKEGILNFDAVFTDNWLDDEKYSQIFRSMSGGGFATKYLTADELKKLQMEAFRGFMLHKAVSYILNPLILLRKIRSFEDFLYMIKIALSGMNMIFKNFLSFGMFRKKSMGTLLYKRPKSALKKR